MGEIWRKGASLARLLIGSTILLILGQNFVQSKCTFNKYSFILRKEDVRDGNKELCNFQLMQD